MDITKYQARDFIPLIGYFNYSKRVNPIIKSLKKIADTKYEDFMESIVRDEKGTMHIKISYLKKDENLENVLNKYGIITTNQASTKNTDNFVSLETNEVRKFYKRRNALEFKKVNLGAFQTIAYGVAPIITTKLVMTNWDAIAIYLKIIQKIFSF